MPRQRYFRRIPLTQGVAWAAWAETGSTLSAKLSAVASRPWAGRAQLVPCSHAVLRLKMRRRFYDALNSEWVPEQKKNPAFAPIPGERDCSRQTCSVCSLLRRSSPASKHRTATLQGM